MTDKKQVNIRDHNATVEHDFPFKLGDEVIVNADGEKATVEDAVWDGEVPHGFYEIQYTLKTDGGQTLKFEMDELLKLNKKSGNE